MSPALPPSGWKADLRWGMRLAALPAAAVLVAAAALTLLEGDAVYPGGVGAEGLARTAAMAAVVWLAVGGVLALLRPFVSGWISAWAVGLAAAGAITAIMYLGIPEGWAVGWVALAANALWMSAVIGLMVHSEGDGGPASSSRSGRGEGDESPKS